MERRNKTRMDLDHGALIYTTIKAVGVTGWLEVEPPMRRFSQKQTIGRTIARCEENRVVSQQVLIWLATLGRLLLLKLEGGHLGGCISSIRPNGTFISFE
eukprot:CAMPEP_0178560058 /NCGR_PEP_ID=MMETSP0697-20121206/11293_1 /TAXON_ID=265572 /ORGANISM="Extubocellulus spinifer, Strain CCMP396" /LENGTH=99 /DNA_ID=CAMNT_0020193307 /DNA_START=447 /DNA_END=746 /DNA_ORIENTATION=-